jgi:Second Messenger Oligonucleotide or Dinucleotide Synthetase domain
MPVASVDDAFRELLSRIELSPFRLNLASQRCNAIKASIESVLPGTTVHPVGSFERKTKIRPADHSDQLDVQVLVSFGRFPQYAELGEASVTPGEVLQIVRHVVGPNEIYKVMPQQNEHPIVRVEYADQMSIELVPGFEDSRTQHSHGPDGPKCYIVGCSLYRWIPADYDYDAQCISRLNALTEGSLVPTIKLVKAYFRNVAVPLKSFHAEILVANVVPGLISEWKCKGYRYGYHHLLAGFLSEVSKTVTGAAVLQGSFSLPVDSGLSYPTFSSLATFLAGRAEVAWQICEANTIRDWTEFFGVPFPSGASTGAF